MPKVSVIVPCHDVAMFVARCLDCLVMQTLRDIEIICIDDASHDETASVLAQYAKNDSRIKLVSHTRNIGVSGARNSGLAVARGEYIGFVDPDDCVDADFFEKLYYGAISGPYDIAKGELETIDENGKIYRSNQNVHVRKNKYFFASEFTTAIYSRRMLRRHKIVFPRDMCVSEDTNFLVRCVHYAGDVVCVNGCRYHYIRRIASADSSVYSDDKIVNAVHGYMALVSWVNGADAMSDTDYGIIMRRVFFMAVYPAEKFPNAAALDAICNGIAWIYDNMARDVGRRMFEKYFGTNIVRYIRRHDMFAMRVSLVRRRAFRLFGVLMVGDVRYIAKSFFCVRLFGCVPLISVRRTYKTDVRILGVPVLKIKYKIL